VNTIHPVLKTVTDRITERSSAPHTYSRLAKRKTVDPRAGVSPAPTWLHSFLVSPGSTPTLLDAMTDAGLPHLARCGNRLGEPNCRAL
jgi:hypothetical protein